MSRPRHLLPWMLAPQVLTLFLWLVIAPEPRFVLGPLWIVPAVMLAWALPAGFAAWREGRTVRNTIVRAPVGLLAVAVSLLALATLVTHRGPGRLGTFDPPVPALIEFETRTGLHLTRPRDDDRCWLALLCTTVASDDIKARGADVSAGFAKVRPDR